MFIENTEVRYKDISGIISFSTNESASILIKKGEHKSQDVNIIVYSYDFDKIQILNEK